MCELGIKLGVLVSYFFLIKLTSSTQGLPLASDIGYSNCGRYFDEVCRKYSYSLCTRWLRRSCVTCWCHSFVGLLGIAIVLITLSWPEVFSAGGTLPMTDAVFGCSGICGLFSVDICCLPAAPPAALNCPPGKFRPWRPDCALPALQFIPFTVMLNQLIQVYKSSFRYLISKPFSS